MKLREVAQGGECTESNTLPSRGPVDVSCGRVGLSRLETRGTSGGTDAEAAGDRWTCAETIERKIMFSYHSYYYSVYHMYTWYRRCSYDQLLS